MWYVIQTTTGKEKELVYMIERIVPPDLYSECFITYYERIWRKQQKSMVHVERLFPGYVFIITEQPDKLFFHLKKVPAMSKLLSGGDYTFLSLHNDEEIYLRSLLGKAGNHTVRLSYVEKDGKGNVSYVSGPLKSHLDRVVRFQFKKRYVVINIELLGQSRSIVLGIILKEDVQQDCVCDQKDVAEPYLIAQTGIVDIKAGDKVKIITGVLSGMVCNVCKVKDRTLELGVQMFGQEILMEISYSDISKIEE